MRASSRSTTILVVQTLAHLSDLHLGASDDYEAVARVLVQNLIKDNVDHVVVTGDLTEQGCARELAIFEQTFASLLEAGRVTIVPGNHDRVGEDIGQHMMRRRVQVSERPGLWMVQVDTTGLHNRSYFASHGLLTAEQIDDICAALDDAPEDAVRVVLMHHHPIPLPVECVQERISHFLGWPHASELALGQELISRVLGHCDLVLHGHRHVPRQTQLIADNGRPLVIANAGSTTERCSYPVYRFADGRLEFSQSRELEHPVPRPPSAWRALVTAVSTSGVQLF